MCAFKLPVLCLIKFDKLSFNKLARHDIKIVKSRDNQSNQLALATSWPKYTLVEYDSKTTSTRSLSATWPRLDLRI